MHERQIAVSQDRLCGQYRTMKPDKKRLPSSASALADDELLAILIGNGLPGPGTIEMARGLLMHFGGLRRLFAAADMDLQARPGLGPARAARIRAVNELSRRCLHEAVLRGKPLESPDATRSYLQSALRDQRHEVFMGLFLDTRHRVIACEELFRGTIDGATVYPRVVAENALRHGAAAMIVAHNHPSGVSEPSLADQAITRRLKEALALLDIRLLDHFVIGDGNPVSMAARGLM
jgi:DNA repair protein RadC